MTDVTQLIPGRFYWVLVRSSTKNPEWQPAHFTGVACQSACAKWDFIGFNSDVGHHFVEVVDIGPEALLRSTAGLAVARIGKRANPIALSSARWR
ncbi:hypothetical protein Q2941_47165 [Bradyrhizobium sp. UFLA05-153]